MADNQIVVELILDDDGAIKGFKKIEKEADSTFLSVSKSAGKNFALVAAAAGVAAVAVGTVFAKKAIAEASAFEDVVQQFNQALAVTGQFSAKAADDFRSFASEIQNTTKFSDDQVLSTAAMIQNLGRLSVQGLRPATQAALDLATTFRIDLDSSARLVGKAAQGNVDSFKRLGLEIKKGKDDAETFSNTLKALAVFQGNSAKSSETFSGSLTKISNAFSDLLKEIGRIATSSPAIIAAFNVISKAISTMGTSIRESIGDTDIFKVVIINLSIVSQAAIATFIQISAAIGVILRGIQVVGQALLAAVTLFSNDEINDNLQFFIDKTKENINGIINPEEDSALIGFFDTLIEKVSQTSGVMKSFNDGVANGTLTSNKIVKDSYQSLRDSINKTYQQGIVNIISIGAQAIGASLVRGSNAFKDFGKQVLGIIGDMAIQIGQSLIYIGLGIDALKASLEMLSGGAAIAAGFALVALGGLLKSLSSGSGLGATSGGPVGTGPAPAFTGATNSSEVDPDEEVERGNSVVINIEGQILDPVGTATRIAELLKDVTDSNSVVFNT